MVNIVRPEAPGSRGSASIGAGSAQTGAGLVQIGRAQSAAGAAFQQTGIGAASRQLGDMISREGEKLFEQSKRAHQTALASNKMNEATQAYMQAQQQRLTQVTDDKGNPTFPTLTGDLGQIGKDISASVVKGITDTEVRNKVTNSFQQFVSNQQVMSINKARAQQLDFSKAALDKGLGTILSQSAVDSVQNVGQYQNQARQLLDDSLAGGIISAQDHARLSDEARQTIMSSSINNSIQSETEVAAVALQQSPEQLGISAEAHKDLSNTLTAKGTSDEIQAAKVKDATERSAKNAQGMLAQDLSTRMEADALREDELLAQKNKLEPSTFSVLKKQFLSISKKRAKERADLNKVSNAIASGQSTNNLPVALIDKSYTAALQEAANGKGQPLTLEEKSQVANIYTGRVRAFAQELDSNMVSSNVKNAKDAIAAYSFLKDRESNALDGNAYFSKEARSIGDYAELLVERAAMDPKDAMSLARERVLNTDKEVLKQRQATFRRESDFSPANLEDTAADDLGAENFFGINKAITTEASTTYKQLVQEAFLTTGDIAAAKSIAQEQMGKTYGVSDFNTSGGEYMFAPPEKVFPNVPVEDLRLQLETEVMDILPEGIDPEGIKIATSDLTRGNFLTVRGANGEPLRREIISYAVTVPKEIGGGIVIDMPLINPKTGEPVLWVPDEGKTVQQRKEANVQAAIEADTALKAEEARFPGEASINALGGIKEAPKRLGHTSKRFESGKRGVATISSGAGDPGGKSYGEFQLASKTGTLNKYIESSKFRGEFAGLTPGSKEFDAKWTELSKDPEFASEQHNFIKTTHFDPVRTRADEANVPNTAAINEALFSQSVQHSAGGNKSILRKAAEKNPQTEKDWIEAIYDGRRSYVNGLRLSDKLKRSLMNRYRVEEKSVLNLIGE